MKTINANAYDDSQFFSAVETYVKPLGLNYSINSFDTLNTLKSELEKVKPAQDDLIKTWLISVSSDLQTKDSILSGLIKSQSEFKASFDSLIKDKEKIKGIKIKALLESAKNVIERKIHESSNCPVCLRDISTDELLSSLKLRIAELETIEKSKRELDTKKLEITTQLKSLQLSVAKIADNELVNDQKANEIKACVASIQTDLKIISDAFGKDIDLDNSSQFDSLVPKADQWTNLKNLVETTEKSIKLAADPRIKIGQSLVLAEALYKEIISLSAEKSKIEIQKITLEKIYNDFSLAQKQEVEAFLLSISVDMNDFFKYMHQHDSIDQIELKTVENPDGDFVGISYQLNFRGTPIDAPKAFMSESYLNCLGLCLFLASVKTFNKENEFFVLDDVISSFDKNHRLLFARLLVDKFADWQPIVLTHEDEWFSILANLVKGKNWVIKTTKWQPQAGVIIETKLTDLRDEIDEKFKKSDPVGLGNLLGRYTETLLKELCENLEARLPYRPNSYNEDRSFDDLFNSLKSRLKEKKTGLDQDQIILNLTTTQFFRNKTSHGNGFGETLADMRVCYDDIVKFEGLFTCPKGHKISVKYFDPVTHKIRSRHGDLQYDWK